MEGKVLLLKDIFRTAVILERKGFEFYSRLEKLATNQAVEDMFHRLAEDERDHSLQFARILEAGDRLGETELLQDSSAYLQALQGHNLMDDSDGQVPNDPREAIIMGIQSEKDSILLYHELIETIPVGEVRELVGRLLQEEKIHLVELRQYLEEM